jgi:DNA invertase Pin-like site-specific DNA recombinase
MPTYGYARVSTIDQDLSLQRRTLKAAACDVIRASAICGSAPCFTNALDQLVWPRSQ